MTSDEGEDGQIPESNWFAGIVTFDVKCIITNIILSVPRRVEEVIQKSHCNPY